MLAAHGGTKLLSYKRRLCCRLSMGHCSWAQSWCSWLTQLRHSADAQMTLKSVLCLHIERLLPKHLSAPAFSWWLASLSLAPMLRPCWIPGSHSFSGGEQGRQ